MFLAIKFHTDERSNQLNAKTRDAVLAIREGLEEVRRLACGTLYQRAPAACITTTEVFRLLSQPIEKIDASKLRNTVVSLRALLRDDDGTRKLVEDDIFYRITDIDWANDERESRSKVTAFISAVETPAVILAPFMLIIAFGMGLVRRACSVIAEAKRKK